MKWIYDNLYPWLLATSAAAFISSGFIFLPLSVFKKLRAFCGLYIFRSSYVVGVALWAWCLLLTYFIWGWIAVVIGLLLVGIGIFPMALLATGFTGEWGIFWQIVIFAAVVYGMRFLGAFILSKAKEP